MYYSYHISFTLAVSLLLFWVSAHANTSNLDPQPLLLLNSLSLSHNPPLQPSGLSICENRILMVSDNKNSAIFQILPENKNKSLSIFQTISVSPPAFPEHLPLSHIFQSILASFFSGKTYDWEGITCDTKGNIYLASEAFFNIAKIDSSGHAQWILPNIYASGRQQELFQVYNGGIEGLAWKDDRMLYIAAERSERGILAAQITEEGWELSKVLSIPKTSIKNQTSRPQDFAGLWQEGAYLFTLERNNFLVCRRSINRLDIERCWSYRHIENAEIFRYNDTEFGIAEGLARQKNKLYIVVDNNKKARVNNRTDTAPILMIYQLPEDWLTAIPSSELQSLSN